MGGPLRKTFMHLTNTHSLKSRGHMARGRLQTIFFQNNVILTFRALGGKGDSHVTFRQLKSICSASVPPCRNPVKNLFLLRYSNITKSQARTPQSMLLIDAPKPLGNDGNYLTTQTIPIVQLGNHT